MGRPLEVGSDRPLGSLPWTSRLHYIILKPNDHFFYHLTKAPKFQKQHPPSALTLLSPAL